jgi:hypothetical protein
VHTGLASGGRRAFQTLALWLGLVALTIQGLAPLCLTGMASTSGGHSVVICTAHGFETLLIGADGKPLKNAPVTNHQSSDCSLCSVCHAGGGFTTPSPILFALPAFAEIGAVRFVIAAAIPRLHRFSYVTRAPPEAANAA